MTSTRRNLIAVVLPPKKRSNVKFKNFLTILLVMLTAGVMAQVGTITGNIKDAATGESVIGANVLIKTTTLGAATDLDGNFIIKGVKAGTYIIEVSSIGFTSKTIEKVVVVANQTTNLNAKLESSDRVLNETVIYATRKTGTEMSVITDIKKADQIAVGVSAAQITKTADRDAGQILKRIPGISIVDNRYVVIRGLIDRYNTVMLNDVITPSLEVDKKSFSFDLIPSAMIDRMLIYKSGGAELPGEFGGGVVKVYTKSIPDEDFVSVQLQGGYRSGATFESRPYNAQGGTSALGFSNSGNLPESFNIGKNIGRFSDINLAKSLPNNWASTPTNIAPDLRLSVAAGKRFKLGSVEANNLTTISYSNTWQSQVQERNRFGEFNDALGYSGNIFHYTDTVTSNTVNIGVISNFNFRFNPKLSLDFRNFLNQNGSNQSTIRNGYNNDPKTFKNYAYYYQQRTLYSGQLALTYTPSDRDELKVTGGLGLTYRSEPDYRRMRYAREFGNDTGAYEAQIPQQGTTFDAARFYSNLKEQNFVAAANYERKLGELVGGDAFQNKIKAGFYIDRKQREFAARWMSYIPADLGTFNQDLKKLPVDQIFDAKNIGGTGFALDERTNLSDKYTASNTTFAGYLSYGRSITSNLNFVAGIRGEYNTITLQSYEGVLPVNVNYPKFTPIPSLNLSYNLNEKSLLRFAYTYSVNRPEFRELAPFNYYDFNWDVNVKGNSNLKIATINNLDLRYEIYPSLGELITVGVFYKQFTNPIERLIEQGSGNSITYSFVNAQSATSKGLELELRKNLANADNHKFLSRFQALINVALIKSEIKVDTTVDGGEFQISKRPMQGQSPYLVNAGIYYTDEDHGLQVNLLYNVVGPRIYAVGNKNGNASQYEMERNLLDLNITKRLRKNLEAKFSVSDILNQPYRLTQDSNNDLKITKIDESILKYKFGRYVSLGVTYKF